MLILNIHFSLCTSSLISFFYKWFLKILVIPNLVAERMVEKISTYLRLLWARLAEMFIYHHIIILIQWLITQYLDVLNQFYHIIDPEILLTLIISRRITMIEIITQKEITGITRAPETTDVSADIALQEIHFYQDTRRITRMHASFI